MSATSGESASTAPITAAVSQATRDVLPKGCLGTVTQGKRVGMIHQLAVALLYLSKRVPVLRETNYGILADSFGEEMMDQHTRGIDQAVDKHELPPDQQNRFVYDALAIGQRRLLALLEDAIQDHTPDEVKTILLIAKNGYFVTIQAPLADSPAYRLAMRISSRLQLIIAMALPGLVERSAAATDLTHLPTLQNFVEVYHRHDWTETNGRLTVAHSQYAVEQAKAAREPAEVDNLGDERTPPRQPAPAADQTMRKPEVDTALLDMTGFDDGPAGGATSSDGFSQFVRYMREEGGADASKQVVRLLTEKYNICLSAARAAGVESRNVARCTEHNLRPLIALIAALVRTPYTDPRFTTFVETFLLPGCRLHPFLQVRVDTIEFSSRAKSLRHSLQRVRQAVKGTTPITLSDHGADTIDLLAELVAIYIVNLNPPPLLRLMDWVAIGKRGGELSGSVSLSTLRAMGDQETTSEANEAIRRYIKVSPATHSYYGKIDDDVLAGLTYTTALEADRAIEARDEMPECQGNGRTAVSLPAGSEKEAKELSKEKGKIDMNKVSKNSRDQIFQYELAKRLGPHLRGLCIHCGVKHASGVSQCSVDLSAVEKKHAKLMKDLPYSAGILTAFGVLEAAK